LTENKKIDLENGYELVISGDYQKLLNYPHNIFKGWGTNSIHCLIEVKKKEQMKGCYE